MAGKAGKGRVPGVGNGAPLPRPSLQVFSVVDCSRGHRWHPDATPHRRSRPTRVERARGGHPQRPRSPRPRRRERAALWRTASPLRFWPRLG